ncbi:hypothetical protein ACV8VM_001884 [Vibrio parahaemolyticus]|nr:hypothetical protein [Vibrio parahaemolyticus]EGV2727981.1 hypothetical protein [Vibrio parahaemolyticus]EHR7858820.1 hypothetical protein [Vibrio parahaemolyticus]
MLTLDANTIALITLFATIASLAAALFIHKRSLERGEVSKVRDNLISRLEKLTEEKSLRNPKLPLTEREIIFEMHAKVIELEIKKYTVTARSMQGIDLQTPLENLMIFDIESIPKNKVLFRQYCYKLLAQVDRAYFEEISHSSFIKKTQRYYYEVTSLFFSLSAIAVLFYVLEKAILG